MEEIKFGSVYSADIEKLSKRLPDYDSYRNTQRTGYFIPIHVKNDREDNIYMIDTYQVRFPSYINTKDFEVVLKALNDFGDETKDWSWTANRPYDFFYSARVKITDETRKIFKHQVDLNDYKEISRSDVGYYDDKDLIKRIQLCHTQAINSEYFILLRKDAVESSVKTVQAYYNEIAEYLLRPSAPEHWFKRLMDYIKALEINGIDYDKELVEKAEKIVEFLRKQEDIYREFYADFYKDDEIYADEYEGEKD